VLCERPKLRIGGESAKKFDALRDLERRAKEQAKLSALEQARLEAETYESRLSLLLSIHREPIEVRNWLELTAALDPGPPWIGSPHELRERLNACAETRSVDPGILEDRRADDRRALEQALEAHANIREVHRNHRELASRVLCADLDAWAAAISQLRPFEELEELGVAVTPEFHSRHAVHCHMTVSGPEIIPQDIKTLTSTGKLSVKPMPKARFHEVYQDYVCGCVLRKPARCSDFFR
jgi:hypothetical protein